MLAQVSVEKSYTDTTLEPPQTKRFIMTARNAITGDLIQTKPSTGDSYRNYSEGFDRIFSESPQEEAHKEPLPEGNERDFLNYILLVYAISLRSYKGALKHALVQFEKDTGTSVPKSILKEIEAYL
jgi:hypothetical protein